MKIIFLKILYVITLLISITAPANSQSIEELLLLQSKSNLQKLQNSLGTTPLIDSVSSGVPTSDPSFIPNADSTASGENSIIQSAAPEHQNESVVQRYYSILTGERLPVYGIAEFQQEQDSRLLFFNTMGKDYRLAAGDVLRVTLRGLYESDATYKIGRDGNLILPSLAPLNVSGVTINEAENKLLDILRYDDASAAVYISLETARLVTVQVSGAVKNPRTLAIPAFTPLSRVLAYAGGLKETGSLRDIVLRDRDGSTTRVDFYNFLQSPSGANDPLVTDASRIFVGNQGNTVAANGFVARPGIYELTDDQEVIPVKDLLELSGTRIMPPGIIIEALYFGKNGLSQARELDLDSVVRNGEVLNLRFLPTRLTNNIRVRGAVLEEYEIATSQKVSISHLLRDGATLSKDASLDFALIINGSVGSRAIDLRSALDGTTEVIDVGSELQIFTAEELRQLALVQVNSNTDKTLNALLDAEVAELYVNGSRIAYLPPSHSKSFSEIIKPFYRLTPYTSLELTILEDNQGTAVAKNLKSALQNDDKVNLNGGDKIYIFENSFLRINSNNLMGNLDHLDDQTETYSENIKTSSQKINTEIENLEIIQKKETTWQTLSQLFARAGVIRVRFNGEINAILPHTNELNISDVLDSIGFELKDNIADFAVLTTTSKTSTLQTKTISIYSEKTENIDYFNVIDFYTPKYLSKILKSPESEEFKRLEDISLSLYQDYRLVGFGTPESLTRNNTPFSRQISNPDLYPLFTIHEYFNENEGFWQKEALTLRDLSNGNLNEKLNRGGRIFIFTHDFIARSLGTSQDESISQPLPASGEFRSEMLEEAVDVNNSSPISNFENGSREQNLNNTSVGVLRDEKHYTSKVEPHSEFIFSSARFVSGAVERPGYFPVTGRVTLSQLLAAAGGLTENANINKLEVVRQKIEDGVILRDKIDIVDLSKTDAKKISLTGKYFLNAPTLINNVSTGVITLSGEIRRPGNYMVARDDTLHAIIKRAGGFTDVSYPLGAVFTRKAIKESQKESNSVLASQLEQAVLKLSQSDREGAAAQIEAVLVYARQLREQEVEGRLTVNVLMEDPESPVYLQQGDKLFIPKRPAHVSVIGSVQKDTIATYAARKSFADYLRAAGGKNKIADIKQSFILLPNGESIAANSDTLIPPGSVIVVPPKTDRLSALGLTDIVSRVLGNIATSILAINNVQ